MTRTLALAGSVVLLLAGCGGGGSASVGLQSPVAPGGSGGSSGNSGGSATTVTYVTTSSVGDLGTWTVAPAGVTFSVDRVDTAGTVVATHTGTASCATAGNAVVRTCTLTAGSSTDPVFFPIGALGTQFSLGEAPSRSLVVRTGADFDGRAQLHVGLARATSNACAASLAGNYVYVRTLQTGFDLFGFITTDAAFGTVRRADFGFSGVNYGLARLAYTSSPADGTVATSAAACVNGVRTVSYAGASGRLFTSAVNALVIDLPSGQGGFLAFDRTRAATIANVAGRTLRLVEWTPASLVSVASEASATASALFGATGGFSVTLTDTVASFSATLEPPDNTALAVKWATPFAYTTTNVATATFGTPASAPGLFQLRRSSGFDNVLLQIAVGADGKLWGLGVGYVPTATAGGTELRATSWFQVFEP